jgi:hypothetical protein
MADSSDEARDSSAPPNEKVAGVGDAPGASASSAKSSIDDASWAKVSTAMQAAEDAVSQAVHGVANKST